MTYSFNLPDPVSLSGATSTWSSLYKQANNLTNADDTAIPSGSVYTSYKRTVDGAAHVVFAFQLNTTTGVVSFYANSFDTTGLPGSFTINGNSASEGDAIIATDVINVRSSTSSLGSFTFDANWIATSGPTVAITRTTHTGIIPETSNFTIRAPTGLSYDKIATKKFRLKFYDQNEIATYSLTVTWTTATGTDNTVIQLTSGSGDLQIDVEPTNIVNGSITLSINTAVFAMTNFGMMEIGANSVFDTFTYYETGPFTGSFSPNFGLPGQSISYTVSDTNQYPDTDSTFSVKHGNNEVGNGTLVNAQNYTTSRHNAGVSQHGTYTITINGNVIASANYDTNYVASMTTSNGGGKPDRYPLIMTNLFNRNRSIYSIGMTHKDTWDLFL